MASGAATEETTRGPEEDTVFFDIKLFCTETKVTSNEVIGFPDLPKKVLNIKERVEDQCNISVCMQSLSYENYSLSSNTTLEQARIRSGDKFLVKYPSQTDTLEVNKVVLWFEALKKYLHIEDPSIYNPVSYNFEELMIVGLREEFLERMACGYLRPWLNARSYANMRHFVYCGGLDEMMEAYAEIHTHQWKATVLEIKFVQLGILRILCSLSETFQLRREILQRKKGLDLCIKSLLRMKLEVGKPIEDTTRMASHQSNSWMLVQNIEAALELLC